MHVTPLPDGSLRLDAPDQTTRFDMGSQSLFAVFDGQGGLARLLHTDGFFAGRWQLRLLVHGAPVPFDAGRAIGRLWELSGQSAGLTVELKSFVPETQPLLCQGIALSNHTAAPLPVSLALDMDFARPLTRQQRTRHILGRLLPLLPGRRHLWGQGWAKGIQPGAPRRVSAANGRLAVHGLQRWTWAASQAPTTITARGRQANGLKANGLKAHMGFDVTIPAGQTVSLHWVYAQGEEPIAEQALAQYANHYHEARAYAVWLRACHPVDDPLLQSLFVSGLNTAVAMFKQFPGGFGGLLAGAFYAHPPRLYFRDSYWTAQVLLRFRPDLVRRHLLSLALGINRDGSCPSAVFAPHLFRAWGRPATPLDWLPDHYDSPPFFLLLLDEYIRASGDAAILNEAVQGGQPATPPWTLWEAARQSLRYLATRDQDGDGLIEKPYQANDWADNVRRNTWVTYDQACYAAALKAGARLAAAQSDLQSAAHFQALADAAVRALNDRLWDEDRGHFVNYARPGFTEDHFSIDTLLAVYFDLVDPARARRILDAARVLQTRFNSDQPFGDWGVMCVFPLYRRAADLFDITAQPYRYHNGADWPYWDGVYAAVLHRFEDPDWRYVLTRWWQYGLEQGWLTPVEYYSPPHPVGSMLQGWSGVPAAVLAQTQPHSSP